MDAVYRHFERHHGIISEAEAKKLGLTRRAMDVHVETGRWVRVDRGVWRVRGAPESWLGRARALTVNRRAALSHRSAAFNHGIEGFGEPRRIEVVVPYRSAPRPRNGVFHHRSRQFGTAAIIGVRGVDTTGLARTVLDLGAVVHSRRLDEVADSLVGKGRLTWEALYAGLVEHSAPGRNGCGVLRNLLEERFGDRAIPDSVFSRRVARLLETHGLGEGLRLEYELRDDRGLFLARVDLAYPEHRLAIECDGLGHLTKRSFIDDRRRQNRVINQGWRMLNFSWWDLQDRPLELVSIVRTALAASAAA